MDSGRYKFIKTEIIPYKLSSNALDRITSRGIGRPISADISRHPILPLVNTEGHILCSDVDVTTASVAYGRRAIPKLKKELLSSDSMIAKRAVMSLLDMVHDPERAVEAIRLQVVPRLARLMHSNDEFVRQHVLMILQVLAMQPDGKMAVVRHKTVLTSLGSLLSDPNRNVRLTAANTALAAATWYFGVSDLIAKGFIRIIIQRLNIEDDDDIKIVLLEALEMLLDQDMDAKQEGLDSEGVGLAKLLEHESVSMRHGALAVLSQLARLHPGKQALLSYNPDILATLTNLLEDSDGGVRTQAAATLMFLLCTTEAKLRCLQFPVPATHNLLRCAQLHGQPALQLHALKALTSLAEAPDGQALMRAQLPLLQDILPADAINQRHMDTLMKVVTRVI